MSILDAIDINSATMTGYEFQQPSGCGWGTGGGQRNVTFPLTSSFNLQNPSSFMQPLPPLVGNQQFDSPVEINKRLNTALGKRAFSQIQDQDASFSTQAAKNPRTEQSQSFTMSSQSNQGRSQLLATSSRICRWFPLNITQKCLDEKITHEFSACRKEVMEEIATSLLSQQDTITCILLPTVEKSFDRIIIERLASYLIQIGNKKQIVENKFFIIEDSHGFPILDFLEKTKDLKNDYIFFLSDSYSRFHLDEKHRTFYLNQLQNLSHEGYKFLITCHYEAYKSWEDAKNKSFSYFRWFSLIDIINANKYSEEDIKADLELAKSKGSEFSYDKMKEEHEDEIIQFTCQITQSAFPWGKRINLYADPCAIVKTSLSTHLTRIAISKKKFNSEEVRDEVLKSLETQFRQWGSPFSISFQKLKRELEERMASQVEAIEKLTLMYKQNISGLNDPHRPRGVALLQGPLGTGKKTLIRYFSDLVRSSPPIDIDLKKRRDIRSILEKLDKDKINVILFKRLEHLRPDSVEVIVNLAKGRTFFSAEGKEISGKNWFIFIAHNAADMQASSSSQVGTSKTSDTVQKFTKEFKENIINFWPLSREDRIEACMKALNLLGKQIKKSHGIEIDYDQSYLDSVKNKDLSDLHTINSIVDRVRKLITDGNPPFGSTVNISKPGLDDDNAIHDKDEVSSSNESR